jgi:hypothetical protein
VELRGRGSSLDPAVANERSALPSQHPDALEQRGRARRLTPSFAGHPYGISARFRAWISLGTCLPKSLYTEIGMMGAYDGTASCKAKTSFVGSAPPKDTGANETRSSRSKTVAPSCMGIVGPEGELELLDHAAQGRFPVARSSGETQPKSS